MRLLMNVQSHYKITIALRNNDRITDEIKNNKIFIGNSISICWHVKKPMEFLLVNIGYNMIDPSLPISSHLFIAKNNNHCRPCISLVIAFIPFLSLLPNLSLSLNLFKGKFLNPYETIFFYLFMIVCVLDA